MGDSEAALTAGRGGRGETGGEGRRPEAGFGGLGLEGWRRRGRSGWPRGWDAGDLLDHVAEVVLVDVVDRWELLGLRGRGRGGSRRWWWRWIRWVAKVKRWLVELLENVVSFVVGGGIGRSRFVHEKGDRRRKAPGN